MDNIWKSIIRAVFVVVGLSPAVVVIYFALFRSLTKDYVLVVQSRKLADTLKKRSELLEKKPEPKPLGKK